MAIYPGCFCWKLDGGGLFKSTGARWRHSLANCWNVSGLQDTRMFLAFETRLLSRSERFSTTSCPFSTTSCPFSATSCPFMTTSCASSATSYPIRTTSCPFSSTFTQKRPRFMRNATKPCCSCCCEALFYITRWHLYMQPKALELYIFCATNMINAHTLWHLLALVHATISDWPSYFQCKHSKLLHSSHHFSWYRL